MGNKKTSAKFASKWVVLVIVGVIVVGNGALAGWWLASQRQTPAPSSVEKSETPAVDKSISLIATGDMLAHDSINSNAKTADGYDYTKFFAHVRAFTSKGDIRFCNQEGLSAGENFGITGYPSFNAPKEFPRDLQKIGCNTINLANNHMADKGQPAVDETITTWEALKPLAVSGANRTPAERDTVKYIDVKGIKIAYVTFNELNNNASAPEHTITMLNDANVTKLMNDARSADFVMVSVHWGSYEDSTEVGPIQTEWTKKIVDLGADVIIGTGPHVLQKAEWQTGLDGRKVFVWYSIGNFLSSQLTLKERIGGIAVMKLEKTADIKMPVKIAKVGFLPTYMHYDWPAADRASEKLTTRTNFALWSLDNAASPLSRSGLNTTVSAQEKYVRDTLGPDVTILTTKNANSF